MLSGGWFDSRAPMPSMLPSFLAAIVALWRQATLCSAVWNFRRKRCILLDHWGRAWRETQVVEVMRMRARPECFRGHVSSRGYPRKDGRTLQGEPVRNASITRPPPSTRMHTRPTPPEYIYTARSGE